MEQEEKIGSEANAGHHKAVLGEDRVQVERAPCGEAFNTVLEVTLGLEVGNETQVDDQQRGCQVQLQPPERVQSQDNNEDEVLTCCQDNPSWRRW